MRHFIRTAGGTGHGDLPGSHAAIGLAAATAQTERRKWLTCIASLLIVVAALLIAAGRLIAHEIPTDVVIQGYLKPDTGTVNLLLRVPLEAMRDVDFPLRGPGYINIDGAEEYLYEAAEVWLANFVRIEMDGRSLDDWQIGSARLSLPSSRAFASYDEALAHVGSPPLPAATELYRDQALLDVLIRYPITGPAGEYAIDPDFGRLGLRTTTVLHFMPDADVHRIFEFTGSPGLVTLDPRWHHAFLRFVSLGIGHILEGIDHILFVLCLIIPFRRIRPLIVIVTSFTVAHSITLIASAFGLAPKALWSTLR